MTGTKDQDSFVRSLIMEAQLYCGEFSDFDTFYVGGGTPSVLAIDDMKRIIKPLEGLFSFAAQRESTIEVNPGDASLAHLRALRELGFNRISLGVQSWDDGLLALLGRRHTAEEAEMALVRCRRAGFDNISIDLIYAIPGQNRRTWENTLRKTISFDPEHLSCYELTIDRETPLGALVESGSISRVDEAERAEFFLATAEFLAVAGFEQYEASNFARSVSLRCRHNMKYWNHAAYLGLGPAAHSFNGKKRWANHRSLALYITALEEQCRPVADEETLGNDELMLEALFLGMRTIDGIKIDQFNHRFHRDLLGESGDRIGCLQKEGFLILEEGSLKPTTKGLLMADSLALL